MPAGPSVNNQNVNDESRPGALAMSCESPWSDLLQNLASQPQRVIEHEIFHR